MSTYDLATHEPALLDLGSIVGEADGLHAESDDLTLIERAGVLLDAFHEALGARRAGLHGSF